MDKTKIVLVVLVSIAIIVLMMSFVFNVQVNEISSYLLLFAGVYIFYTSFLKKYKTGITIGSALFLAGSILFVISKYEILNLGRIFIPLFLLVIGGSVLLANVIQKANLIGIIFSLLSLFAGMWLLVSRGDINISLFTAAFISILKDYWLVLLGSSVIILAIIGFKKKS